MVGAKQHNGAIALIALGALLAIGMVASAWIVVRGMEYVKLFDTSMISVTGSSHEVVDSDAVKWGGRFTSSIGIYHTSTITKRITGVVHASFVLEQ